MGPQSGLIKDAAGNLYGATVYLPNSGGSAFELSPSGDGWNYNFISAFQGGLNLGPYASLMMDAAGNLYGTTFADGQYGYGTVFKLTRSGGSWSYQSLHNFTGGNDGASPMAPLILDSKPAISTARRRAADNLRRCRVQDHAVNKHSSRRAAHPTCVVGWAILLLFNPLCFVKTSPSSSVTAESCYSFSPPAGRPDIGFRISHRGANHAEIQYPCSYFFACVLAIFAALRIPSWAATETPVYSFTGGLDGANPASQLIFDGAGNAYGTTVTGGSANCGTVFELTRNGEQWQQMVLYSFGCFGDGKNPYGGLTMDARHNLYGTTVAGGSGGTCSGDGCGVVFKLSRSGDSWMETVLYSFGDSPDAAGPGGAVVFDHAGNLLGTSPDGGEFAEGTIYELSPSNGAIRSCPRLQNVSRKT